MGFHGFKNNQIALVICWLHFVLVNSCKSNCNDAEVKFLTWETAIV